MGLRRSYIKYINKFINYEFGGCMLELGDQVIRKDKKIKEKTGKEYFTNMGLIHTSIDMNGLHNSIKQDLSKPIINPNWINHFDIITNSGTSEHIEPFESQYECFKNIHNFCITGGIMIHIVPDAIEVEKRDAFKKRHCNNYYTKDFFNMLAEENKYYVKDISLIDALRCTCLKKLYDTPFMGNKDLFLSKIVRKDNGRIYSYKNGIFSFK